MKYKKNEPRLIVKFIDSDTDEIIAEMHNRTWMNVGEILTDYHVSEFMNKEELIDIAPENLMIIVVAEYTKND